MVAKKRAQTASRSGKKAAPTAARNTGAARKALPNRAKGGAGGEFRSGRGRVDITGVTPKGTHVDPDITEGHPGYQESGGSEIIPNRRLAPRAGKRKSGSARRR